jgi:hypothetical protein
MSIRKWLVVLVACLTVLIPGRAALASPASPAHPRLLIGEEFTSQNNATGLYLHAHCLGCNITVQSGGIQDWFFTDTFTWFDHICGCNRTTGEIQLVGSPFWCIVYDNNEDYQLAGCDTGFGNGSEQFAAQSISGGEEFINAFATAHDTSEIIATDDKGDNTVDVTPPGFGLYSAWKNVCVNC